MAAFTVGEGEMTQPVDALWTRVICKQPGRYIGWPTVARTKTGELLAVFSGDREEHVCPWGKTHLVLGGRERAYCPGRTE